jgi:hypothetical protein
VLRREGHHVLDARPDRVGQRGHPPRIGRVGRVQYRDAALVRARAEAGLGAAGEIREAPAPDVGVPLVHPHVGVEAAPVEVVVPDRDHIERSTLLVRRLRGRRTGDDGGEARDRGDGETAT